MRFWRKGGGETVSLAIVSIIMLGIVVCFAGVIQVSIGGKNITQAVAVCTRTAAISTNYDEALASSQAAAEVVCADKVDNIIVSIDYIDSEWKSGNVMLLTVTGNIDSVFLSSQTISKSMIFTIE